MTSDAHPDSDTGPRSDGGRDTAGELSAELDSSAAERLTFFSDAVVAIALTLLALELPVPEGDTLHEVLHGLGEGLGEYLAFAISFAVISTHWRTHHRIFRAVNGVSRAVVTLNLGWLFFIVITPWSTKLLSSGHINIVRFGQYAAIQTIQYALLLIMIAVLIRGEHVHDGASARPLHDSLWRVWPVMVGFGLSIPVYLLLPAIGLSPYLGYALWGVLPTLFGFLGRALRARTATGAPALDPDSQPGVRTRRPR